MNKTELTALRVLARRREWSVDELPPLLNPDILRRLDTAGLAHAQQVLVRDMRKSADAPTKPTVVSEAWRSLVASNESWEEVFARAVRDYWNRPYRVRITELGKAELSRWLEQLREDSSETVRLTRELSRIAVAFDGLAVEVAGIKSVANERSLLQRLDGLQASLGQCIAECHELWPIPECEAPFAGTLAPERMVETDLDAEAGMYANFAQDVLAEMARTEPARLRSPDLLEHEPAALVGKSAQAIQARGRRASHVRAFSQLALLVGARIRPIPATTGSTDTPAEDGTDTDEFLPIGAFPKRMKSRIELAARETSAGKRKSMQVRRESVAGSWRYSKADVRLNWPQDATDLPEG